VPESPVEAAEPVPEQPMKTEPVSQPACSTATGRFSTAMTSGCALCSIIYTVYHLVYTV